MAGATINTAIFITVFNKDLSLTVDILWQIIVLAAVCSLGNLMYHYHRVLSKRQMKIRMVCHYVYINIVMIGGGFLCGWLSIDYLPEIVVMFVMVAVVYIIIMTVNFHQEEKIAENLNRQLRKRFPSGEE
jgi:Protein of unknown function (DUF3021).